MEISETIITKMLDKQDVMNKRFLDMEEVRVEEEVSDYYPKDELSNVISRTEVHQDGSKVELRRFIDRKLYKVEFKNGLELAKLIEWLDLEDTKFKLCCR